MPTTAEFLAAFVLANPATPLCAACLATKIGAPPAEVERAMAELDGSQFVVKDERCGRCGRPAEVLRLR